MFKQRCETYKAPDGAIADDTRPFAWSRATRLLKAWWVRAKVLGCLYEAWSLQPWDVKDKDAAMLAALGNGGPKPAGRTGHMPDFPVAYHSRRDEGPPHPSHPSRHSFVVTTDRDGEETCIVDPLLLQPAQDLDVTFRREGFIAHSVEKAWTEKVARKQNCSYLAVKAAGSFMYSLTDDWKVPEPGHLFDKNRSMTEQQREEEHAMLEWLHGRGQIKVRPKLRAPRQYVPKRPQIVSATATTLQYGLRPSGDTS